MDLPKRPITCHDCQIVFDTHNEFQQHILEGSNHRNCAVCGKHFGGQNPAWILQRIGHTRVTGHGYRCEACDLILWSTETLEEHRKDEHECLLCKTTCENAEEYEKHFLIHPKYPYQPTSQTPTSQKLTSRKTTRRRKPTSTETKRIKCIGCNQQHFKTHSEMIKHIEQDFCPSAIDWMRLAEALLYYDEHWRYAYFEVRDNFLDDMRDRPGAVANLELFFCPGIECQMGPFRDFYSLLKHVESKRCEFSVKDEFMVDLFKYLYEVLSIFGKPVRHISERSLLAD